MFQRRFELSQFRIFVSDFFIEGVKCSLRGIVRSHEKEGFWSSHALSSAGILWGGSHPGFVISVVVLALAIFSGGIL